MVGQDRLVDVRPSGDCELRWHTIAFSNPIWQLREQPPGSAPIPQNG